MFNGEPPITVKLVVDLRTSSAFTQGYAFVSRDGGISELPPNDFWINVPLHRTYEIIDYVDKQKDDRIQKIQRQEINPFYLEYAFFDDVERNKVNNGIELTDTMINFILSNRPEIQGYSNEEVRQWYDLIGRNELPWRTAGGEQVGADDIEKSQVILTSIISKAGLLNIDIYS